MKLITTAEMAKLIDVHPETIRRWVRDERIPCVKVSKTEYRFIADDVMDALKGKN